MSLCIWTGRWLLTIVRSRLAGTRWIFHSTPWPPHPATVSSHGRKTPEDEWGNRNTWMTGSRNWHSRVSHLLLLRLFDALVNNSSSAESKMESVPTSRRHSVLFTVHLTPNMTAMTEEKRTGLCVVHDVCLRAPGAQRFCWHHMQCTLCLGDACVHVCKG